MSLMDDNRLEIENRIKNLAWTVSGDYSLKVKPDAAAFQKAKNTAIYDTIKQGALAKYLDRDALTLYLIKKLYFDALLTPLLMVSSLCIEEAVGDRLIEERKGVDTVRRAAYEEILDREFDMLSGSALGTLRLAYIREKLDGEIHTTKQIKVYLDMLHDISDTDDTYSVIACIDSLYNALIEPDFAKKKATLSQILSVTMEELKEQKGMEDSLSDILKEDMEVYVEQISENMSTLNIRDEANDDKRDTGEDSRKKVIVVSEEALKKMHRYVALNYGITYLSKEEETRLNRKLCRGVHEDCSLYFTDGILHAPLKVNYQYEYAKKLRDKNKMEYYDNHRVVKRNIQILTDMLRRSFLKRLETDYIMADNGRIDVGQLWKVDRSSDARLFRREFKKEASDFVVDILIDASGSQRKRQGKVATAAYTISEALSNLSIPHRVMSFCSFWDYTILQRLRDYEDERSASERIFDYMTSANNRDGLALLAVGEELLKRKEESKVLIVLSDGKPYDVMVNKPNQKNAKPYKGDTAINDTAHEVRVLRSKGVAVMGVFAGEDSEVFAEQKIFGRDFAYIREISGFSHVVGRYLTRQIDEI